MPSWMLDEIEDRREKGTSRSEYVREAAKARFREEDAGSWEPVEHTGVTSEQPAD